MTKKNVPPKYRRGSENKLGVPQWKGLDIINLRKRFAPAGKTEMTQEELAELMGFGDRSTVSRYENQKTLTLMASYAFEFVNRFLSGELQDPADPSKSGVVTLNDKTGGGLEFELSLQPALTRKPHELVIEITGGAQVDLQLKLVLEGGKLKLQVANRDDPSVPLLNLPIA